jgi:hypothetical protein
MLTDEPGDQHARFAGWRPMAIGYAYTRSIGPEFSASPKVRVGNKEDCGHSSITSRRFRAPHWSPPWRVDRNIEAGGGLVRCSSNGGSSETMLQETPLVYDWSTAGGSSRSWRASRIGPPGNGRKFDTLARNR